jgi:hypothetical protein
MTDDVYNELLIATDKMRVFITIMSIEKAKNYELMSEMK